MPSGQSLYAMASTKLSQRWLPIDKQILLDIISEDQKVFIKGRHLLYGVSIIHELIHSLNRANKKGLLLKLDMKKAFDRVNWGFLSQIMKNLGFANDWIQWAISLFTTPSFSVLINGCSKGLFKSSWGIQ